MTTGTSSSFQLTKTNFIQFLECPREFWLRHHHPESISEPIDAQGQYLIRQGYEIERIARGLVEERNPANPPRSQHTVVFENLLARFDIFVENTDGTCEIYEVKSGKHIPSTEKAKAKRESREANLYDLGFQVLVARRAGLNIAKAHLVTIDGDYERGDFLEPEKALHFEDVTDEINALQTAIEQRANEAINLIASDPGVDFENLCSNKLRCPYFVFKMPELPEVTIFDIPGLRGDRLENLKLTGALAIADIKPDADLTDNQWAFIDSIRNPSSQEIKHAEIRELIENLEYPLYFLDYETVNPAIPAFRGMRSYEQITFQYSVHVQETETSDLQHREFLSDGTGDLQRKLAESLVGVIGENGTIISWNKSFEQTQNRLLGRLYPEYAARLESINERMFDLGLPFQRGLYNHPEIKGWSIKYVLPVLVPKMSYENLAIGGGAAASAIWYMDVFEGSDQKEQRMDELREYCKQDTLAMVEILDVLKSEIG